MSTSGDGAAGWAAYFEAASDHAGYRGRGWKSALARDMGVSDSQISKWLSGRAPDIDSCKLLAAAWRVPILEVLVAAGHLEPKDVGMASRPRVLAAPLTPLHQRLHEILSDPETSADTRRRVEGMLEAMAEFAEAAKPGERRTG